MTQHLKNKNLITEGALLNLGLFMIALLIGLFSKSLAFFACSLLYLHRGLDLLSHQIKLQNNKARATFLKASNMLLILLFSLDLIIQSIEGFYKSTPPINGYVMLIGSLVLIFFIGIGLIALGPRSPFKTYTDFVLALVLLIDSLVVTLSNFSRTDGLMALCISGALLYMTLTLFWQLNKSAYQVPLNPKDLKAAKEDLIQLQGIKSVEQFIITSHPSHTLYCHCHLVYEKDLKLSEVMTLQRSAKALLNEKYKVNEILIESDYLYKNKA